MRSLVLAVAVVTCAVPALAQDCTLGAYADPEGSYSTIFPEQRDQFSVHFSVYVVMFTEDTVAAAAYRLVMFGQTECGPFLQSRFSGPSGNGLVIDEPTGTNVALAECVIGFGAQPVLVDEYQFLGLTCMNYYVSFSVEPNTSQGPDYPQYVTCNDIIKDCDPGPGAHFPLSNDSRSFGAIKSLYAN